MMVKPTRTKIVRKPATKDDENSSFKQSLAAKRAVSKDPIIEALRRSDATTQVVAGKGGREVAKHLIVKARAGTGKTFTLVEGIKRKIGRPTPGVKGSDQQEAVWDAMMVGGKVASACFVAFNKSIAEKLAKDVPPTCQAMTMHSMGFSALRRAVGRPEVENWKVSKLIEVISGKDWKELRKTTKDSTYLAALSALANLTRQSLTGWSPEHGFDAATIQDEELDLLAAHYDVQLDGERERVYSDLRKLLTMIRERTDMIDFTDMIWLPVANLYPVYRHQLLLVDEAQDLNRCQQELAKLAGERIILCGDEKQAIYGFAGADTESLPRMFDMLSATDRGCDQLPLTVTRRCGLAIVEVAKLIVPDFSAHESVSKGEVLTWNEDQMAKEAKAGDMILCRVTAPLVSHAFRFLKAGRKANIQGRDIGEGLIRLVEKLAAVGGNSGGLIHDAGELLVRLDDWYQIEAQKLGMRKFQSEAQQIALRDKRECLEAFCEGASSVTEVIGSIRKLFDMSIRNGNVPPSCCILLSSIHRAKGLEADRVFILAPELLPHPMAKSDWQRDQESNLKYVAVTRAIHTLVWTSGGKIGGPPKRKVEAEDGDE